MSATANIFPNPATTRLATPAAELSAVTKRYRNGVTALHKLSLTLYPGEIVALLGPNGAGKSTAVKLLMGLAAPTSGQAHIFGQDPRYAANRLRTGVMLQVGKAPETLRVREHIDLFRGYYPSPLPAGELLRIAGLDGLENRLFGQLSGGQKQRVLFALALAGDPDLIFLDEPTVGLDIEARRALWAEIRALAARGKTVLLTTHYLEEADTLASRIIVINKGELICQGTPAQIKAQASRSNLPDLTPSPDHNTFEIPTQVPSSRPDRPPFEQSSKPEHSPLESPEPGRPFEPSSRLERPSLEPSSRPERAARSGGTPVSRTADTSITTYATTKIIRCSTTLTPAHLRLIPGVTTVDQPPRQLNQSLSLPTTITTTQPEATLREVLALDLSLTNLEVTSPALEDAFLALTSA